MGSFKLEVELGNADMRTPRDVADALEKVASQLRVAVIAEQEESRQKLYDVNGNTVGEWELALPDEDED